MIPSETFNRLLTHFQTHLKRRKGVDKCLSDPYLKTLHDLCVQLNIKAISTQLATQARFVVIDTETTGLRAYSGDEIISICLLEMRGLKLTGRKYNTHIDPMRPIPAESTAIHGIRDADIVGCPKITDILTDIIEFIGESILVGHHLAFDLRFLNKTLQKQLLCQLHHPWIDTMLLYTAYSGRMGHYTLDEIAKICRINVPARHTAYGDAMATALIFQQIATNMSSSSSQVVDLIDSQFQIGLF
jgi:DNA polymerase-3 subunit epsilon